MFGRPVCPPSSLTVAYTTASSFLMPSVSPGPWFPRSLRQSYHEMARLPVVWSSAIRGRNWLDVVASSFTRSSGLHVAPWSSEDRNWTSISLLSSGCSVVYRSEERRVGGEG